MFVIFETFALPEGKSLSDLEKKRDEIVRACVIKLSEWKKNVVTFRRRKREVSSGINEPRVKTKKRTMSDV